MAKKKMIKEEIKYGLDLYEFDGSIEEVIETLQKRKEKLEGEGWSQLSIDIERCYSDVDAKIYGYREETDAEYKRRLADARKTRAKNKKKKAEKEEAERKKLRELAKKYPEEVK